MRRRHFTPDTPDLPVIDNAAHHGWEIGLDAEPSVFGGHTGRWQPDTRTGVPPAFTPVARARWASEREALGIEAFLSSRR